MGRSNRRRRSQNRGEARLPKDAYRHPDGGIVLSDGTRTQADCTDLDPSIVVRGVKRDNPELKKLAKALVAVAREVNEKNRSPDHNEQ